MKQLLMSIGFLAMAAGLSACQQNVATPNAEAMWQEQLDRQALAFLASAGEPVDSQARGVSLAAATRFSIVATIGATIWRPLVTSAAQLAPYQLRAVSNVPLRADGMLFVERNDQGIRLSENELEQRGNIGNRFDQGYFSLENVPGATLTIEASLDAPVIANLLTGAVSGMNHYQQTYQIPLGPGKSVVKSIGKHFYLHILSVAKK